MNCKHELHALMGTADGIVCRACGRLFSSMDEILAENAPEPPKPVEAAPAQKKSKKKKEA